MNAAVLVVDDEPTVLSFVRKLLERAGYETVGAPSADRALEHCERSGQEISLVVTDVQMPGMSGRKLAERLGSIHPNVPVLFMTGYMMDSEYRDKLTGDGRLDGHLIIRKPFQGEVLLAAIDSLLCGSARVGQMHLADASQGD